jgi:intein/homing endonuclease
VYHDAKNSVNDIVISRTELVKFLVSLGLPIGNKVKQKIDIPIWIRRSKDFLVACIRGLIDTDGCVFVHSYKIKNKIYQYKKLAFSNRSKPLIKTVYDSLKKFGFSARITKYDKDIRIESRNDIKKYFKIFGSHNPKHLKKYHK